MRKCFIIAEDYSASHWFVPYFLDYFALAKYMIKLNDQRGLRPG
jgi:hypothetical protein